MTSKIVKAIAFALLGFVLPSLAQDITQQQRINQSIFNKVEFHFNQQETDSIYAMVSPAFRQALSLGAFETVLKRQLYPLGQISNAQLIDFAQGTGTYRIDFESASLQMLLTVDSLNQIGGLIFQPYKAPEIADTTEIAPFDPEADTDKAIDALANAFLANGSTRALSVGIIHDNKTTTYYYGETEKGNNELPSDTTLFEIGSISKTFTATLLAYLDQNNTLQLDDRITRYLPDSLQDNEALHAITLRHLANHTSGLPRLPENFDEVITDPRNPYASYTTELLYDYLQSYTPRRLPGDEYEYSNLGYAVLGTIIAHVAGVDYETMVRDTIAAPLGLTHLKQHTTEADQLIPVHDANGNVTPHWDFDAFAGAGALRATTKDLLNYARAHFKMPESDLEHALALTRQFTYFNPPDTDIGLAWHMTLEYGSLVFIHTGGTGGSSAYIAMSPDDKLAVVVLSNAGVPVDETGNRILEFLLEKNR